MSDNFYDARLMFSSCDSLIKFDGTYLNTENVTDMYGMFAQCTSLTDCYVNTFNTSSVLTWNLCLMVVTY